MKLNKGVIALFVGPGSSFMNTLRKVYKIKEIPLDLKQVDLVKTAEAVDVAKDKYNSLAQQLTLRGLNG